MLQINQLNISPDKKNLVVDVQVQDLNYFKNVYIDSIYIDTQKTFRQTGPSVTPFYQIDCKEEGELKTKHYRGFIPVDSVSDNLFFVWIIADGEYSEDTPCGMKDFSALGVAYDKYPMYLEGMKFIKEIEGCNPPLDFIDYILRNKAFELSLNTGNYETAINYWNSFFNEKEKTVKHTCGCYG